MSSSLSPQYDEIKRLVLIAMLSDDVLVDLLVLKGGSALELIYDLHDRASLDLDFSMIEGLNPDEEEDVRKRMINALTSTLGEAGYRMLDFTMKARPTKIADQVKAFWGGYEVLFKVTLDSVYDARQSADHNRRLALRLGRGGSPKFSIDISSYEYCSQAADKEFEGYGIRVYTPEMIVAEKARAVCQQLAHYREVVHSHSSTPRARDFFDIYLIVQAKPIEFDSPAFRQLLEDVFAAKRVPISYLLEVAEQREFHRKNFEQSLVDTISAKEDLEDFDVYFDYFIETFSRIALDQAAG